VRLERYPKLEEAGYQTTSPPTAQYNCFAWAAGDADRWWAPYPYPPPYTYWPPVAPRENSLEAYIEAFGSLGYTPCDTAELEAGFEKVAFYGQPGAAPKHAARQLENGRWSSKIGQAEDIEHTLDGLVGSHYGDVVVVLRRARRLSG
jgi:hypothetical protein